MMMRIYFSKTCRPILKVQWNSKHLLYALEADDTHQMEERAHALKGSSSKICAGPVREAAQLLERVRRSEDLSGTATL